ncbi:response regulator transcription factor (plasmid) [Pseudoalteromonas sp. T1lg65]|uniref:response regulator transcription factor n=1 Tax=Pseudoalteromonas sp. T1lg65 TaxID=2077101 RepID=UPI003F7A8289
MKILLVEDNPELSRQLATFFDGLGWLVDYAITAKQAYQLVLKNEFDVIVLDINLPDGNGFDVCRDIRTNANYHPAILMLTARDSFEDKSSGFNSGSDDYLTKPFDFRELALRCEALARRKKLFVNQSIQIGQLNIDHKSRQVSWNNTEIPLTQTGFDILAALASAYPKAVTKSTLIEQIWPHDPPSSGSLKSHIYNLRKALEKVVENDLIHTVSNVGYQLRDNHAQS